MVRLFLIFLIIMLPMTGKAIEIEKFQARPDQVLVIYNEDWVTDADGSQPGQDSREVADYYVRKHTDSIRNLKPYLLGLTCIHRKKHLNDWYIKEKSQDNKNGVLFKGRGLPPGKKQWARDSRHVEIVVHDKDGNVDWNSARIWCVSLNSRKKVKVSPLVSAIPIRQGYAWTYPPVEKGKGRCFRFNAHELFSGTVSVFFKLKDTKGNKVRDLKLRYYDRDDFEFSRYGKDKISDEKHFQENVAIPIKRFLEDPRNALPDGTLLKDHILYIVICHGLPFSCEGVFGIARGVTPNPQDHGDLGSLEQRLQTLYYDWGNKIVPPVISMYMAKGPDAKNGVRNFRITSALCYPLFGKRWNIYMHPDTYSFLKKKKEPIKEYNIPPFPQMRQKYPGYFFGYGVSRVDGQGPEEAKRLVDYALYASRYLRPEMVWAYNSSLKKETKKNVPRDIYKGKYWGMKEIPELGYEKKSGQRAKGLPFLKFKQELSGNHFRYLPGGMDFYVDSANGWNGVRDQPIWKQIEKGVTVSACGGPAYGGGPHITNATFWDNRIMMRYLFRGRDLGESFLLSTYYVNWSTSLIGDPLYHPDLSKTIVDHSPPTVLSKDNIKIELIPTMGKCAAVITCPVQWEQNTPEVALLQVDYSRLKEKIEKSVSSSIFSARPKVVLRGLELNNTYQIRLILSDPYGNRTDLSKAFGLLTVDTCGVEKITAVWRHIQKKNDQWKVHRQYTKGFNEKGTIQVKFKAGPHGLLPSIVSRDVHFQSKGYGSKGRSQIFFKLGGVKRRRAITSPLQEGETATMLFRWRRSPLTREVLLMADDGTQMPLIADIRTPWKKMMISDSIKIVEEKGVSVVSVSSINDADVFSETARGLELPPLKN